MSLAYLKKFLLTENNRYPLYFSKVPNLDPPPMNNTSFFSFSFSQSDSSFMKHSVYTLIGAYSLLFAS